MQVVPDGCDKIQICTQYHENFSKEGLREVIYTNTHTHTHTHTHYILYIHT
jgi:hypothetical protein